MSAIESVEDLRVVKVRSDRRGGFVYEVRHPDARGIEHVLTTCMDENYLQNLMKELKAIDPSLRRCALGLEKLLELAQRIAASTEEQGNANYATKAHMRSWGLQMTELIQELMELCWDPICPPVRSGCENE